MLLCIVGKTPEEIRKTFNIKNDFTPEEEEQVRGLRACDLMLGSCGIPKKKKISSCLHVLCLY